MSKRRKKRSRKAYTLQAVKKPQMKSGRLLAGSGHIRLTHFLMDGFAGGNAKEGDLTPMIFRGSQTSDDRLFHLYLENLWSLIADRARESGHLFSADTLFGFLLVIHQDQSADLYLNQSLTLKILIKRDVKAGELVYSRDIADVRAVGFNDVSLVPTDKVVTCFKVDWKFGLFFDFHVGSELDVARMESDMATTFRHLRYEHIYKILADSATYNRMTEAGWFPFVEIIGGEIESLIKAIVADFDIEGKATQLIEAFTSERIDSIASRWWKNSYLVKHRVVLESGLSAFKRGDCVATIKLILTEIEGILADAHLAE